MKSKEASLRHQTLTDPTHERGENLQIFGLLGAEEGERTQQKSEDALQEERERREQLA